ARGIDFDGSFFGNRAHGRDAVAGHCHVGAVPRGSSSVDDGAVAHDEVVAHQSTLAPERRTTSAHFGVSLRTNARNSSGVPPSTSVSSCLNRSSTNGEASALRISACSFATISRGRFAGA